MPKTVKINSFFKNKFLIILVVIGVAAGGAYAIINSRALTGVVGLQNARINSFTASPNPILPGGTVTLSWSVDTISACTVTIIGAPYTWSQDATAIRSVQYPHPIDAQSHFYLACNGISGAGDTADLFVNLLPAIGLPSVATSCDKSTGNVSGTVSWSAHNRSGPFHLDAAPANWNFTTQGGWWKDTGNNTSSSLSGFSTWGSASGTFTLSPSTAYKTRIAYMSTGEHSGDRSFTTPACSKTVNPPPPKTPTTKSGSKSKIIANTPSTPTNPADTIKPTPPANLFAEQIGNGEVELTWDESTDAAGIDSYTVERSSDGIDWTILDDAVLINSFSDTTSDYGVTYSYRVSAKDKSGNFSDYAVVDIETNSFSANVYADEDSSITSEDGNVTVNLPAGSLGEDAFCEITKDTVKTNPKGYKLAAGGYIIECKNSQGDSISQLDKAAKVTMNLKSSKYKSYTAYSIDSDGKLEQIKSTFNSKSGELSFQISDLSNAFAAYGKSGGSAWWLWLIILLILILAVIAFIRWRRSRSESAEDAYYDSAGYVTMPPTAPVGPNGGGTGGYEQHTSLPDLVAQGQQQQQQPQQPYQEFPPAPPIQGQPGEFPEQDPNQYPPQPPGPGQS